MNCPRLLVLRKAGSEWGEETVADMVPIRGGAVEGKRFVLATKVSVALKVGSCP